jgi:hypothetical protein
MRSGRSGRRVYYEELRAIVEREGGKMYHERRGHPAGGAWILELDGKRKVFEADGLQCLELASVYVPLRADPTCAIHYSINLIDDAETKWLSMIHS